MTTDHDADRPERKRLDDSKRLAYVRPMIKSFKHKGLAELWEKGRTAKLDAKMLPRIQRRLDQLEESTRPEDMNLPGFDFHSLKGFDPARYTVHVNGPWCITFAWDGAHAVAVDLENYH